MIDLENQTIGNFVGATHTVDLVVTTLFNIKTVDTVPRYVLGYLIRNLATGNTKLVAREEAYRMGLERDEAYSRGEAESPQFFDNAVISTSVEDDKTEFFLLTIDGDHFRDEAMIADFTARTRAANRRDFSSEETKEAAILLADRIKAKEFPMSEKMEKLIYLYKNILYPRSYITSDETFKNIADLGYRITGENYDAERKYRNTYGRRW